MTSDISKLCKDARGGKAGHGVTATHCKEPRNKEGVCTVSEEMNTVQTLTKMMNMRLRTLVTASPGLAKQSSSLARILRLRLYRDRGMLAEGRPARRRYILC